MAYTGSNFPNSHARITPFFHQEAPPVLPVVFGQTVTRVFWALSSDRSIPRIKSPRDRVSGDLGTT